MNICVILRGISGSGKSTFSILMSALAKEKNLTCTIHNTDSKFMIGEKYQFNPTLLGKNHQLNFEESKESISNKTNIVIIDNCSLSLRDFRKYSEEAKIQGFSVAEVIFMPDTFKVHFARNLHNVPEHAIKAMIEKFNSVPIPSGLADSDLIFTVPCTEIPGSSYILGICDKILSK